MMNDFHGRHGLGIADGLFDAHAYAAISNALLQRSDRHSDNGQSTDRRLHQRRYQQAFERGLWNLHERFPAVCRPTVGIELELYLVDSISRCPVLAFDAVWSRLPSWARRHVKKEAFQFQIEIVTGVHGSVEEAGDELAECLAAVICAAEPIGIELEWRAGLDRFEFDSSMLFMSERTRSTLKRQPEKMPLLHHNSMHVHVGVERNQAIRVSICACVTGRPKGTSDGRLKVLHIVRGLAELLWPVLHHVKRSSVGSGQSFKRDQVQCDQEVTSARSVPA